MAGSWQVDSTDPANPLSAVSFAEGLDEPKVKGRVATGRKKFRLSYDLREIDGQKVTFTERGAGIANSLGKARGDVGTISFKPTIAAERRRTIEAEISHDGLPRELITVAKFKAPKQPKIKQPRVKAKRRKKSLSLSWARVAGAADYIAEVSAGKETLYRVLTKKNRLRFAHTPKQGKLKVGVAAGLREFRELRASGRARIPAGDAGDFPRLDEELPQ